MNDAVWAARLLVDVKVAILSPETVLEICKELVRVSPIEERVLRLKRVLAGELVELAAERSWCKACRTLTEGPHVRERYTHPHKPNCVLFEEEA